MVPIGAVLAGKYRVDRILGQGGMGVVVQAMHLQLYQPVAMKFLLPEVISHPQVVQRFLREAQAVVRLKSEHVARVIDVGSLEGGIPYIVLEYLDGTDLSHFSREQLTIGQIVDLMLQACEALAEAHSIGIVHRDIKPANFFITQHSDGSRLLKVLDFGIAKANQATLEGNLTATSTVMGTPAYMSPEQMKSSRDVDNRSDIWSLGVVLYELLQGAPPFAGETFGSMAIKVATEPLPPLSAQLPPGLADIVYRCLEKDPARRFQNIAELSYVLAPYAQSTVQAAVSVERASRVLGTNPQRDPSTLSGGAITQPPRPARRFPFVAGAIGLFGALIVIAIVMSYGDGGSHDPAPQAGA
ncbi:MAG TPA: serine/threonine-protein kinase, partial [Kofleriaceae bacterium]|nr:serine/threonine-protein kinase [Kofleriaceae bacterium]